MPLPQINKMPRINGDSSEGNRILKDIESPEDDRDAATKKWVTDNFD